MPIIKSDMGETGRRQGFVRNFFKDLLMFYIRYIPIKKGKKLIMNLISPIIVEKGYEELSLFDDGIKILLNLDDWIQRQIYYFGYYYMERNETTVFKNLLHSGDVFIDIGANIVVYSLQAAKIVLPKGKVYAFEPVSKNFQRLQNNVNLNSFSNVILTQAAVSDKRGLVKLYLSDNSNIGTSSVSKNENWSGLFETVESITIDGFITSESIKNVSLVKIDVEGCEFQVLCGMKKLLASDKPPSLLIEIDKEHLEASGTSPDEIYVFLSELNYEPFLITERGIEKINYAAKSQLLLFQPQNNNS